MSWVDQSGYDMRIRTGDGTEFTVLWMRATKAKDYNISEFNFPGVAGTLVSRGTPKGRKYNLEIYFQGDDHLDFAASFDEASDDPRHWTIIHPYYGSLFVQPVGLDFDNIGHNVTKITGTVIETILEDKPKVTIDATDQIVNIADLMQGYAEISVTSKMSPITIRDKATLRTNTTNVYNIGIKSILSTVDFESYFNLFNQALTFIENATEYPLQAIRAVQAVINAPFQFIDNVRNRINTLTYQFDILVTSIGNLINPSDKRIFENNLSNVISGMALTSVTNYQYDSREDVLFVIDTLIEYYNSLLSELDGLQTDNGGDENSYHPDVDTMIQLSLLVNYTVANLFVIAISAKQQRSIVLEEDSNAILLTHRFYGISEGDAELNKFILDNKIGLSEIFQIKKGRRIVYYL